MRGGRGGGNREYSIEHTAFKLFHCSALLALSDLFLIYMMEYVKTNILWRGQLGGMIFDDKIC